MFSLRGFEQQRAGLHKSDDGFCWFSFQGVRIDGGLSTKTAGCTNIGQHAPVRTFALQEVSPWGRVLWRKPAETTSTEPICVSGATLTHRVRKKIPQMTEKTSHLCNTHDFMFAAERAERLFLQCGVAPWTVASVCSSAQEGANKKICIIKASTLFLHMCAAKTNTKVTRDSKRQTGGCLLRPGDRKLCAGLRRWRALQEMFSLEPRSEVWPSWFLSSSSRRKIKSLQVDVGG